MYERLIKGLGMDTLVAVFSWNMKSSSLKSSSLKGSSRKNSSLKSSGLESSSLKTSSVKASGEVGFVLTFEVRLKGECF